MHPFKALEAVLKNNFGKAPKFFSNAADFGNG
jgi:hypothetical protein